MSSSCACAQLQALAARVKKLERKLEDMEIERKYHEIEARNRGGHISGCRCAQLASPPPPLLPFVKKRRQDNEYHAQ